MNRQIVKRKHIFIYFLLILMAICLLFSAFSNNLSLITSADSVEYYSSALEDLVKDPNFKATDYAEDVDDNSLHLLQIAESSDKELFVYVYQPSATEYLQASSINISTTINENLKYQNYKLTYLNSNGVFFKYKVDDFIVSDQVVRYYDISSIYRHYYDSIDDDVHENQNTKNEKAYAVAKLFTVITNEDGIHYYCSDTKVIEVTNKYVSYITQISKLNPGDGEYENCHYVAFSADIDIDRLFEADVSYVTREHYKPFFGSDSYGEFKNEQITITYTEVLENPNPNILGFKVGRQYKWNRIETVEHFLANTEDLGSDTISALQDKKWVLWFTETAQQLKLDGITTTEVSDVTILRLKFETDGVVYNLGVVDNKQSKDYLPNSLEDFWGWLTGFISVLLIVVVVVILVVACGPQVFVWIGKAIWAVIKFIAMCIVWLFKGLWWLITMPFEIFKKEE